MEELRLKVIEWAKDRGIMEKATPLSQCTKVLEECLELVVADLNKDRAEIIDAVGDILVTVIIECELSKKSWVNADFSVLLEYARKDLDGIKRKALPSKILKEATSLYQHVEADIPPTWPIRGILAFLLIYCKQNGIDPVECLQGAYDVISKRKGKMVNGVFVKDGMSNDFMIGVDPASDEPSHSAIVQKWADGTVESVSVDNLPRPDLIKEMQELSKHYKVDIAPKTNGKKF